MYQYLKSQFGMNTPATSFLSKFEVGVSGVSTFKMTINLQWS